MTGEVRLAGNVGREQSMQGWEQEAVQGALEGRPGAYARLVNRYTGPVRSYVYRIVGDHEISREITHQAFVAAFENLDSWDPERRFFSWICRIAHNLAVSQVRQRRRTQPLEGLDLPAAGPSPEDRLADRERDEGIRRALRGVPLKYRLLLNLRYYLDLPYADIARILDLPTTTVKSRLHMARGLLRREWEQQEDSGGPRESVARS